MASTNSKTSYRIYIKAEIMDDHKNQTPLDSLITIVFKVFQRQTSYDRTSFAPKTSFVHAETSLELLTTTSPTAAVSKVLQSATETPPSSFSMTDRLYWEDRESGTAPVALDSAVSKISAAARPGSRLLVTVEKRAIIVAAAEPEAAVKRMSRARVFPRSMDLASLERSFSTGSGGSY